MSLKSATFSSSCLPLKDIFALLILEFQLHLTNLSTNHYLDYTNNGRLKRWISNILKNWFQDKMFILVSISDLLSFKYNFYKAGIFFLCFRICGVLLIYFVVFFMFKVLVFWRLFFLNQISVFYVFIWFLKTIE